MQKLFSYKEFFNKVRDVIISPVLFWRSIKNDNSAEWRLLSGYYLPMVIMAAFAVFISTWLGSTHFYVGFALLKATRQLLLFILLYFICVFLVNHLITTYDGTKDRRSSQKLIAYSLTPLLLVSVVSGFFPALYIIDVIGFYGAYIFITGVKELVDLPKRKQSGYIFISLLLCLFVFGFLSIVLWKIFIAYY